MLVRLQTERNLQFIGSSMTNPKGDLIEYCRANGLGTPSFETNANGPEHQPVFTTQVVIANQVWATAEARTKRDAEKVAAAMALESLEQGEPVAASVEDLPHTAGLPTILKLEPDDTDDFEDEGPWPIFPEVLAKALEVANARVDAGKRGEDAVREVGSLALELYKDLLEDLGDYT
jgi:ribonuclease III